MTDRPDIHVPDVGEARALLGALPYPVLALRPDGRIARVFGRIPAEFSILSTQDDSLLCLAGETGRDELLAAMAEAAERGAARCVLRPEGGRAWLALDLARLFRRSAIAIVRDVPADHAREASPGGARIDAGDMAVMSHELRTPLNAIMGFSDIMRQQIFGPLPDKYVEYAELIHDAGAHLLSLIGDVLDLSKIEAAKYALNIERLDAREPLEGVLRLTRGLADEAGVWFRGVLPSQALEIDADRRALKQIALNLISNALKFTPRGGRVTVSLRPLAGAVELSVTDNGIGIAAEDLARLGRPFEQAGDSAQQAKGAGLGLSLVRALAELHGGEMAIESQLGEGAVVTVRLPARQNPSRRSSSAPPSVVQIRAASGAWKIAFNPWRG